MCRFLVMTAALMCCGMAFGQVWNEQGDAGELPGTAQVPIGSGPLTGITGTRASDADMYLIRIVDAVGFGATTNNGGSAPDTQLFLFDAAGIGITHNDDDPGGGTLLSTITGAFVPGPGDYLLTVSSYNYDPLNPGGLLIWNNTPFSIERPPDGPGAPGPVASWSGTAFTNGGYQIDLRGVEFVPEPSTLLLLGLGGLALIRRR